MKKIKKNKIGMDNLSMGKSTLVKKLNHFYHDFISKTNDEKLIEFCDIMNNLVSNDQFLSPNMPVIEGIVESIGNNEDHDEDYDPEAYLLNSALDYADILECTGTLKYGFQSRIEKLSEISDTDEFLAVFNKTLDDLYYTADELCTNFSGLYDEMQMLSFIKTSIIDTISDAYGLIFIWFSKFENFKNQFQEKYEGAKINEN